MFLVHGAPWWADCLMHQRHGGEISATPVRKMLGNCLERVKINKKKKNRWFEPAIQVHATVGSIWCMGTLTFVRYGSLDSLMR
jgi:hypothetical protein